MIYGNLMEGNIAEYIDCAGIMNLKNLIYKINKFIFNTMKVILISICGYVFQIIPYKDLYEHGNIPVYIITGMFVWSLWYFAVMIADTNYKEEMERK